MNDQQPRIRRTGGQERQTRVDVADLALDLDREFFQLAPHVNERLPLTADQKCSETVH
jgi:hypothetical protein